MVTLITNGLRRQCHWSALWLLLLSLATATAAPKFEASVDRDAISLSESVTLTLTFEEIVPNQLNQPSLPDFNVLRGPFYSDNVVVINNQTTHTGSFSYLIQPRRVGDLTIPAMTVDFGGKRLTSNPVKLKVFNGPVPGTEGITGPIFVKVVAPKKELYLGEIMTVDVQCYCQQDASVQGSEIQLAQLSPDGLMVGLMPMANYRQQAPVHVISGKQYAMYSFRMSVRPIKTGTLKLGPATWALNLLTNPRRDFFGGLTADSQQRVTVTNQPEDIIVHPLPAVGVPPGFNGAVGNFSLAQYEASPNNVAVGDPVTLKIRITGSGGFDALTLPSGLPEWREFKTYAPTAKFDATDPLQINGSKYFEQVITPQNAEIKEIPTFTFSYFNPENKTYQTLTHAPLPLSVRPTVAAPQPTIISTNAPSSETPPPSREIVHIQTNPGKLVKIGTPLLRQPGFILWQSLAPALWIGTLFWRRRQNWLANNPRALRQREVARLVEQGLQDLPKLAQSNQADEFYATLVKILQEQLGERLDLPASGLTESVLDNLPVGLSPETTTALRELFRACNQYRYAPGKTSEELQTLITKAATALRDLQKSPATKSQVP